MSSFYSLRQEILKYLSIITGCILFCTAFNLFIVPHHLYNGGTVGIAQIIQTLLALYIFPGNSFDLSGLFYLLLNIPLLILAYYKIGRNFFYKTLTAVFLQSFLLTAIPVPSSPVLNDALASCLIGGIIAGAGIGFILRSGGSSGGPDIIGIYLMKRSSDFSVGKLTLIVNLFIYSVCALLFSFPSVIYSIIYTSVQSLVVDKVHYQNIIINVLIFSKKQGLEKDLLLELNRGITCWQGFGAYTGKETSILMTVVSKYELPSLKKYVHQLDKDAFIIINKGMAISGNFKKRLS
jgi:uncharacterized membrane-anchored protein YitT (DUF2179 family)